MPYNGADDPSLPENVKKLSAKKKRQWVHVFNSAMSRHHDEGKAFAMANSVALKELEPEIYDGFPEEDDVQSEIGERKSFIKSLFGVLFNAKNKEVPTRPFWIEKSTNTEGKSVYRVFAVYSNCFKDREHEIICDAAHKEYVQWADETKNYPEFHLWHGGPGTRFGQVDFLAYADGFAIASGLVDSDKVEIAEKLKERADKGELLVSHGYFGVRDSNQTYLIYRTFEISPLPKSAAANPFTAVGVDFANKETELAFNDAKRKWLKEVGGYTDEQIATLENNFKSMGEQLKSIGLEYKEDEAAPVVAQTNTTNDSVATSVQPPVQLATDTTAIVAAMKEVTAPLMEQISALKAEIEEVKKAREKSVENAAAELNLGRIVVAAQGGGFQASKEAGTIVPNAPQQKQEDDWFLKEVSKQLQIAGGNGMAPGIS